MVKAVKKMLSQIRKSVLSVKFPTLGKTKRKRK
jgi:hypothetical protein